MPSLGDDYDAKLREIKALRDGPQPAIEEGERQRQRRYEDLVAAAKQRPLPRTIEVYRIEEGGPVQTHLLRISSIVAIDFTDTVVGRPTLGFHLTSGAVVYGAYVDRNQRQVVVDQLRLAIEQSR